MAQTTLKQLLSAILHDIMKSRAIADQTSAHLAKHYLQHEYLKGFPIPRMHIKDIELDLCFAIASSSNEQSSEDHSQAKQAMLEQTQTLLNELTADNEIAKLFSQHSQVADTWQNSLPNLLSAIQNVAWTDQATTAATIAFALENFFYAIAAKTAVPEFMIAIDTAIYQRVGQQPTQTLRDALQIILQQSNSTTAPHLEQLSTEEADLPECMILIAKSELETLSDSQLQRIKITLGSADRKWIKTNNQAGEERYILDHH